MAAVLLIDDEASFTSALAELLRAHDHSVVTADSLGAARATLARSDQSWDLLMIDLMLPDGNGLELLDEVDRELVGQTVVMTGHHSIKSAIKHLHGPGIQYLTKPIEFAELQRILDQVEPDDQADGGQPTLHFGCLIGESEVMQALYAQIEQVAPTDTTVLINGESGTGKELVAEAVHTASKVPGPFLPVNCGALSSELVASELFGHEVGSFTGARKRHLGVFERASEGTLFLDEITEMPLDQQPHLLRAIESGQIARVGGEALIPVAPRLVAASNRNLGEAIAEGALREDLYFRLSVFPVQVPPLRERRDDVPILASEFLRRLNLKYGTAKNLGEEALERLCQWSWPGNVRELKHLMHRAYIGTPAQDGVLLIPERLEDPIARSNAAIEPGRTVRDVERELILATVRHFDGNRKEAAQMLGISIKTLYNRLTGYQKDGVEI